MDLEICKATLDMADAIGEIGFASWNAAYADIVPEAFLRDYTPQKRADTLRRLLPERPEEYYLFRLAETPVGFAIIGPPQDAGLPEKTGEVHAFYFMPDVWGRGYAGDAMAFCLERLRALGYTAAVLWVLEDNARARRFYEKQGFRLAGRRREITLGKPLYEVFYSLDLRA